ncbi:hypothetical protein G9A89_002448 [Geosiphon pyriformis]|nr:hypothetical protein G9A89_002448 [Geosiphon pyriformis]
MMATSHTFPPDESLPHPPINFQPQNAKQAVIYNKKGTKCMNIVKELSPPNQSPLSSPAGQELDASLSHISQNGIAKKKKKKKGKRKPGVGNNEESDVPENGTVSQNTNSSGNYMIEEELPDEIDEDQDEFFSDDDGYDPEAPEIPFPRKNSTGNFEIDENHLSATAPAKKKKKKKKNKTTIPINQISADIHPNTQQNHSHKSRKDGIWNTNNNEERQRIREFWLQLGEEERRSLVKVEKEMVLKKMKEQQKSPCSCSVCGKKRTAIEEELEQLYDAYYEELEQYANQQEQYGSSPIDFPDENGEYEDDEEDDEYDDDDDDDDDDYEGSENGSDTRREIFQFGNPLTVKGGILTVADDLMKNDGKKFLEMMERLAERRMQREEEAATMEQREFEEEDEEYDDEYEDEADEDHVTQEQRMKDSKQMFQIFAAKMFEQRVLNAYKEKVAQERQKKFLEELEEENRLKEEREQKKLKEKEKKNAKKRAQKQQKEEERARKEAERLAEEAAIRAEREKKAEEERKRREEERLRKEAERRAKEEERLKKEEEKRRKAREEKEREERRRKEQEAKERKEREERERKEKEERARKEQEIMERKQREERERKERQEKELKAREKERKEREEREKREREEKLRKEKEEKERKEREEREEKERREREEKQRIATLPPPKQQYERKHQHQRQVAPIAQPPIQTQPQHQAGTLSKVVGSMANGGSISWINYQTIDGPQNLPPQLPVNPTLPHLPPSHQTHHLFGASGANQPLQYGGQAAGIPNDILSDIYTNNKKVVNPPTTQTNTIPGINSTSSLFATGLGTIGMGVQHHGPPVMHPHHQMRQAMPPRGYNAMSNNPHLPVPPTGVPTSVASSNLSILNEPVLGGNGNIGSGVSTIGTNPPNVYGGLPLSGAPGTLGVQTFNLGTQVIGQTVPNNIVSNPPLAPIGHSRRMSTHHDDSHLIQAPNNVTSKAIQRPAPIQRPRRGSASNATNILEGKKSPPPGFPNILHGDDEPISITTRRQSLVSPLEPDSYFSSSLFPPLPAAGRDTCQQVKQNPSTQVPPISSSRSSHRHTVSDQDWPPIRRPTTETINENSAVGITSNSVTSSPNESNNVNTPGDLWRLSSINNSGQSLWYQDGMSSIIASQTTVIANTSNAPTTSTTSNNQRRAIGARDFGIP